MTTKQPEALRLAELIEDTTAFHGDLETVAELRRLHWVNADLLDALQKSCVELQACQAVIHLSGGFDPAYVDGAQAALKIGHAAIAKATGGTA